MIVRGFLYAYLSNYYHCTIGGCMAYLYRLALILFFCLPSISRAEASHIYYYYLGTLYSSSSDVCSGVLAYMAANSSSRTNFQQTYCGAGSVEDYARLEYSYDDSGSTYTGAVNFQPYYICSYPTPSISNTVSKDAVCTPPPNNCTDGEKVIDQTVDSFSDTPFPPVSCIGGCEVLITKSSTPKMDCGYSSTNNTVGVCVYYLTLTGVKDGNTCTGSAGALPPPANLPVKPSPCPVCDCLQAGKSWGTVNGTTVCVTAGSAGSNPISIPNAPDTTKDSSGNTSNTYNNNTTSISISSSSSSSSGGGSSSGGSSAATGTVTSTKADGSTTTQTLASFCEQNPNSQYCKQANNGNFSGSCSGGFSCDGDDAVKCAIAQETYRRNCQLFDNQTTLSQLGNSLVNGTDPQAANDPTTHKTTTDLASSLNEDAHFSGELTDQTVSVGQFGSITLPFSKLNSILVYMGYILLAFAYIAAVKIVGVS